MARKRIRRTKDNSVEKENKSKQFIKDVQYYVNDKQISCAISIIKHADGSLSVVTTDDDATEIIGVIEVGKNIVYEDRFYNQDD